MSGRVCYACKVPLTQENAAKDKRNPDGMGSECVFCKRKRGAEWRSRRDVVERRQAKYVARRDNPERKQRVAKAARKYYAKVGWENRYTRRKGSDKEAARRALRYAVARGKVVRPEECQSCGERVRLQGHHHDYTKPLDVRWLCAVCHGAEHRTLEAL